MAIRAACWMGLMGVGILVAPGSAVIANDLPEERTGRYLASIGQDPERLLPVLRAMPKGGDLHLHLAGAIYAESWIDFAAQDHLCVDRRTSELEAAPCDASCAATVGKPAVTCAYQDQRLYDQLIDAWSMRNFTPAESGHDRFFGAFQKFRLEVFNRVGEELAEVASRAAADNLQYVEVMHTADGTRAADLGTKIGWNEDLPTLRRTLLTGGLPDVMSATRAQLDADETRESAVLQCDAPRPPAACHVTVRYLYQALRGMPPSVVFAQLLLGFELATADSRFVGVNLVMPEDGFISMHDFPIHMRMLDYLHTLYPKVHVSLHAGELAKGLVPPESLRSHIRASIERGHAERIGHGVAVVNEDDPLGLLEEMKQSHVLVEICLTSNDVILGVRGADHPLPTYLSHAVPVALATDDQGVSRSDMTHEYLRAIVDYHLDYSVLKRMARQSLEHSFLAGPSLWREPDAFRPIAACATDRVEPANEVSPSCRAFLASSDRARAQWELEQNLSRFEQTYGSRAGPPQAVR